MTRRILRLLKRCYFLELSVKYSFTITVYAFLKIIALCRIVYNNMRKMGLGLQHSKTLSITY